MGPTTCGATGRVGGSGPPRASDPSRLRWKESSDVARRGDRRHARGRLDRFKGDEGINSLRGQSLLSLRDLSRDAMVEILDTAESFVEVNQRTIKKVPA